MKLSIIIPAYNEEKTLYNLINKVNSVTYQIPYEILIVNDGSTDKTYEQLVKLKKRFKKLKIISYKKNRGKGYAIRLGIKKSKGDIIIIQDADLEYSPQQIPKLIKPILENESKVVYGSRFLTKPKNMSSTFLFGNKILTLATNILFFSHLSDIETCYKVMHKDIVNKLDLNSDRFEIEGEITAKILKLGYKIKELSIDYTARTKRGGKKIHVADGIKTLMKLLSVRFS